MLNSCATRNIAVHTGVEEITFGSGGGFTGAAKSFKINAYGKVFENDTEMNQVSFKKTFELFNQAKVLKEFDFN